MSFVMDCCWKRQLDDHMQIIRMPAATMYYNRHDRTHDVSSVDQWTDLLQLKIEPGTVYTSHVPCT